MIAEAKKAAPVSRRTTSLRTRQAGSEEENSLAITESVGSDGVLNGGVSGEGREQELGFTGQRGLMAAEPQPLAGTTSESRDGFSERGMSMPGQPAELAGSSQKGTSQKGLRGEGEEAVSLSNSQRAVSPASSPTQPVVETGPAISLDHVANSAAFRGVPGGFSGLDIRLDSAVIAMGPVPKGALDVNGQLDQSRGHPSLTKSESSGHHVEATGMDLDQHLRRSMSGGARLQSAAGVGARLGPQAVVRKQQPPQPGGLPLGPRPAEAAQLSQREAQLRKERSELILEGVPGAPHTPAERIGSLGIMKLIEDIESDDPPKQKAAAHELRMLAKYSEENRGLIAQAGGVRPLANLVKGGDPEIGDEAVTALLNLSIHNQNKLVMPAHGVLEPLIQVMETGSLESRENAAATMFSLSVVDDNKAIIGDAGAIPPLVEILQTGTEQGQRDACKALFNLSIWNANKLRIVDAGAVQSLVLHLQEPGSGMAEKAVSVMANLATIAEGRDAIAAEDEGIPGLVEVVESGTHRGKENAAATLYQLAKNSRQHRQLILQEVVILPLVALSQTGTPRAKEKAVQLLKDFREQR